MPAIVYCIDGRDRIVFMNEASHAFAKANGAPQLTRGVIGRSLWDFISGRELRTLWSELF